MKPGDYIIVLNRWPHSDYRGEVGKIVAADRHLPTPAFAVEVFIPKKVLTVFQNECRLATPTEILAAKLGGSI